jgi:putative ABC transport system ATP-binding protein
MIQCVTPSKDAPELRVTGLRKSYDATGVLVDGLDLAVAPGESVAITGPSGSGKSTVLHMLGGLVAADAGRIEIGGVERTKGNWDDVRAKLLGYVFQEAWLLPSLTVAENIEIPMIGVEPSARNRRKRVDELLEALSMTAYARRRSAVLSGGERQRVALARALANKPKLLLADEPTGNLDAANTELVKKLLLDLCRENSTAVVVATHDLDVAASCSRHLRLVAAKLMMVSAQGGHS